VLTTNGLLVAGAALSTAITSATRTAIDDDSLLGFLALLALLLVLALAAIIRFETPERTATAEEPVQAATPAPAPAPWIPSVPAPQSGQRRITAAPQSGRHHVAPRQRPVAPAPLPVRVPSQQPGYAARHAPSAAPSQGTPDRPSVTGGPPWGPAPRPPGSDPFLRGSD
jgi:hypothetical protein